MTRRTASVLLLALASLVVPGIATGHEALEPYRDPPFANECQVVDYGTTPPEVPGPSQDPLCVRYDKTNITVTNLGVVDFLSAEPGRVGISLGKCSYWQQDHWVVRVAPATTPVVEWQGSYWYDARSGSGGGILRGLKVAGQPADGPTFIAALRPLVGDARADEMSTYVADGGGGGASFTLPDGFDASGWCSDPSAP